MSDDFLSSLELSTRAERVLRDNGVTDAEQLLELTWEKLNKWRGGGRRTWIEIRGVQKAILRSRGVPSEPSPLQRAHALLAEINALELPHTVYIGRTYNGKFVLTAQMYHEHIFPEQDEE